MIVLFHIVKVVLTRLLEIAVLAAMAGVAAWCGVYCPVPPLGGAAGKGAADAATNSRLSGRVPADHPGD